MARKGVARRFGGVLPKQIDHEKIPRQHRRASLTRWLQGKEIRFGGKLPSRVFYEQVKALMVDVLRMEPEEVKGWIVDAQVKKLEP